MRVSSSPLADGSDPAPWQRLATRMGVVLAGLLGLLATGLLGLVGPDTTATFLRHGETLRAAAATAMRELARAHDQASNAALLDLIERQVEERQVTLATLRRTHREATADELAAALTAADAQAADRLRASAPLLTEDWQRRTRARIDAHAEELRHQLDALGPPFAAGLRQRHLTLIAAVVCSLLGLAALLLHRFVLRPVQQLRVATRAVARGELAPPTAFVQRPDEIGALTRDFAAMVRQLDEQRARVQQLTSNLEAQVAAKTRHLEQAIEDLRQTHRQLAQADKLATIGTLAGGIAHEFNNLIGGIRGCTQELLADERDDDRRQTLQVIGRAADRATAITGRLLGFARRTTPSVGPFDPARVAADALALVEPEARRRRVQIERDLTPGLQATGEVDGLHQALLNLLTNALQAMPTGGRLDVRCAPSDGGVAWTVTDTGVGIDKADLERIFEPFFTRRGDEKDPAQRGTGLGLAMVWSLVQAHGGKITVASEPGHGSTFRIWLPPTTAEPGR